MDSSGDLLADRRYAYAEASFQEGDLEAAADLARQVLDLVAGYAPAWFLLGQAREAQFRAGDSGPEASTLLRDAVAAYENAVRCAPEDRQGARARLAGLGIGDPLQAVAPAYVRALFDDYAIRFDRHLTRSLRYRGPELLHDAVRRACSLRLRPFRFDTALDLGCGTGLAAELFRPACRHLAGVDLSPAMLEKARRKNLYDEVEEADLAAWLSGRPSGAADLILAADVFVYLGDLDPVVAAAAAALAKDGLFAFTVQAHEGEGVVLGEDLRYAHAEPHLRALAARHGWTVVLCETVSTREDRGVPVPGGLLVLAR